MKTRNKVIANLKPSALLTVALDDLIEVRKDKRYSVSMATWHTPGWRARKRGPQKCFVCLAGAVMAKSLRVKPTQCVGHPQRLGNRVSRPLCALNRFRTGQIYYGLQALGINGEDYGFNSVSYQPATCYHNDSKKFFRDMRNIVKLLESKKL